MVSYSSSSSDCLRRTGSPGRSAKWQNQRISFVSSNSFSKIAAVLSILLMRMTTAGLPDSL